MNESKTRLAGASNRLSTVDCTEEGGHEGGIRFHPRTQDLISDPFPNKVHFGKALNGFWFTLVVCGCLALFGIRYSTYLAQPWEFLSAARPILLSRPRSRTRGGPDVTTVAATYSRYSSDLQDASSIIQQQRQCHEKAAQNGHTIPPEFEFADEGVSGTKRDRDGLDAMLAAARNGLIGTVYFDNLSRLAREFVISMPILKELVQVLGVRVISVSENIDSDSGNWEVLAIFGSWMHQEYIKTLRSAVLRGQEDAHLNDFSVGDWCFGYESEPIPGSERGRRGRNPKPRMRVVVHDEQARWVRQIFSWFVTERSSITWIARELTRLNAPKDHRATRRGWHPQYVRRILSNRKYIGIWPWGLKTNVRNPLTGQVSQEERPLAETAKWEKERPLLRILDDDIFFKAAALLQEFERFAATRQQKDGRFRGATNNMAHPRHLLQGLIKCGECDDGVFQVSGAHGNYLGCVGYKKGACPCKTRLPRLLTEQMILGAVGQRLLANEDWLQVVLQQMQSSWEQFQRAQPDEKQAVEKAFAEANRKMQTLLDVIERGGAGPEIQQRLAERRMESFELERRLASSTTQNSAPPTPPTESWAKERLNNLHSVLVGGGPAAALALKELIGSIVVKEIRIPGSKRKRLQGTFRMKATELAKSLGVLGEANHAHEEIVAVVFAPLPPWASLASKVKELFDAGMKIELIAEKLACPFPWVAKAFSWWHTERDLPVPDGRKLKARLQNPTLPKTLADEVKARLDKNMPLQEIAKELGCCRDTVTAAMQHWYESRSLEVPDGRTRRKNLPRIKREPS